jgi:TRAP-type C4-dicarboxylate transport system substrate-binding protein
MAPPGPPVAMSEFGISRVTSYHYLMRIGFAPLALLMNKKKFESLPPAAQDIIRKFSGEWLAARYADAFAASNELVMKQFKSDPKRTTIISSQADIDTAQAAFATLIREWQPTNPRNAQLLAAVETELAKLRSAR